MKTSVIEVRDMLSVLSVPGVEKRIGEVPGVESVTVNFAAGSATVRYDETRLEVTDIKSHVRRSAHETAPGASAGGVQKDPLPPGTPPSTSVTAETKLPAVTPAGPPADVHKGHTAHAPMPADMAHEMGHDGNDMAAMVRDMRNRFWICLAFTVPIFVYAPMGDFFAPPAPPFGLELNLWLFFLASAAVLYPSWPFFVSAWRAIRKGILGMAALIVLSVGTGYLFSVGTTFFFMRAGSSSKPWPSCWFSSCSATGWKCAPVPARLPPSRRCWISLRRKPLLSATASRPKFRPRRCWRERLS